MAEKINMSPKQAGDQLIAPEFNNVVAKVDAAIEELNQVVATGGNTGTAIAALQEAITAEQQARIQADSGKVDTVAGKGLSTNDFTSAAAEKLANIAPQTSQLITWATGEEKPTIAADKLVGELVEGKTHIVTLFDLGVEKSLAEIKVVGVNQEKFVPILLSSTENFLHAGQEGVFVRHLEAPYYLKKYALNGQEDTNYNSNLPSLDGYVHELLWHPDGGVLIRGGFSGYLKKINADGTEDAAFLANLPELPFNLDACYILTDSRVIVVRAESYVKLLNADGSEDTNFSFPASFLDAVDDFYSTADGGFICIVNQEFSSLLQKFHANGSEDATVNANLPELDGGIDVLCPLPDGSIIVAGNFTGSLKKLNADGTENTAFAANVPEFDDSIINAFIASDNSLIVLGEFSGLVKKINADGTEDSAYTVNIPESYLNAAGAEIISSEGDIVIFPYDGPSVRPNLVLKVDGLVNTVTMPAPVIVIINKLSDGSFIAVDGMENCYRLSPDGSHYGYSDYLLSLIRNNTLTEDERRKLKVTSILGVFYMFDEVFEADADLDSLYPPQDYQRYIACKNPETPGLPVVWIVMDGAWMPSGQTLEQFMAWFIKMNYDMNPDTNPFTDSEKAILESVATGTAGDLFIIGADGAFTKLAAPTVASVLGHSGVAGTAPAWSPI